MTGSRDMPRVQKPEGDNGMKEPENNLETEIQGTRYVFLNKIGTSENLFDSFNSLAQKTFGLRFSAVGGEYEPHVLALDGKVCANVSVNQIPFYHGGKRKLYIQLGTVMTDPQFRGKGLSRWLIEHILEKWKGSCDALYLFANDSVLDFYPKFGFVKAPEFEYIHPGIRSGGGAQRLPMNEADSVRLALEKYRQGNPFSALYMAENQALFSFYCMDHMKESVYYSSRYDVIFIADREDGKIRCCDIFGRTDAGFSEVLKEISWEDESRIILGFTPKDREGLECRQHFEKDTTLFVYEDEKFPFYSEQLMFPVISHA